MKITPLGWAIVLLSVSSVFAIKSASDEEKEAIQQQIAAAALMDKQVIEAAEKLRRAEESKADPETLRRYNQAHRIKKDKQDAAFTKAVRMTLLAYDLWPAKRKGISVMKWTKGREIEWLPVARAAESRRLQNAKGEVMELGKPEKPRYGATYSDGTTYVDRSAFKRGVGFLATTLLHERVHFEQYITPGRADKMSDAEGEEEAYRAELESRNFFFDEGERKDLAMISEVILSHSEAKAAAERERERRRGLKGLLRRFFTQPEPDGYRGKPLSDEELAALKKQSDDLETVVRQELEEMRRKRQAREQDERTRRAVRDLAVKYCADPSSVSQEELDRLPRPAKSNFHVGTHPPWFAQAGECVQTLYLLIARNLGSVDSATIRALATPIAASPVETQQTIEFAGLEMELASGVQAAALAELARTACIDPPGGITREHLKWINSWFPEARIGKKKENGAKLSGCAAELYQRFLEFNDQWSPGERINPDWINVEAKRLTVKYASAPPNPQPIVPGNQPAPYDPAYRRMGRNTGEPRMPHISDPFPRR